ncbi:Phospholipid-transporting atpase, partial [Globisporangium splendens]
MAPHSTHAREDTSFRKIHLNNDAENERLRKGCRYTGNRVATSKYTLVSFLPKMLFEFFRVIVNCYFLAISILQVATPWSPTNQYTTAGPLLVVLLVSMVKQGLEDKKRHDADEIQNSRFCKVLGRHGEAVVKQWQDVRVGDVLCLSDREEAPADVFILSTSEEEGRCFVETCNLDGETNLKRRAAIEQVAKHIGFRQLNDPPLPQADHCKNVMTFTAMMEYELPNNRLYNFTGRIEFEGGKGLPVEIVPLGPSNIILRGYSIRGCECVFGVVIFTGPETKLMQNARATPSKQSNVYKMVNRLVWVHRYESRLWYFGKISSHESLAEVVSFFTFLILYNNLVPISLYVSLDMIKVLQAKYIASDDEMCYEGKHTIARTSDLNEELGQVEYIFSDKTGTLTRNIMEFRKCFMRGISYGFGTTEIGRAVAELAKKAKANTSGDGTNDDDDLNKVHDPRDAQIEFDPMIHFDDPRIIGALDANTEAAAGIDEFLTILSVCHTVIPEANKDGEIEYRASSPDEEALVKATKCLGYNFLTPAPVVDLRVTKKCGTSTMRTYTILNVNEFNSTRKRMSVVVRTQENRYFLYCKGADNVMLPCSRPDEFTSTLEEELKRFASEGLRTLVLSSKELSEEEYFAWDAKYQAAVTSLVNRDEMLADVAEALEKEMQVVGATAIEDKLQEGVPSAIFNLAQAGIKIWMLTGDKEETAINIGHACRLIGDTMRLLIVNHEDLGKLTAQVDALYESSDVQSHIKSKKVSSHLAIVCDGKSLVHVFPPKNVTNPELEAKAKDLAKKLLEMASICQALIACRVSPAQKADIVNLVRFRSPKKVITLVIGDGANDVNMIQSAHVGVGVSGQEGVQAVSASDYAIAQFRFLERLLLVHGRYNYRRVSKVILYSFYKNVALVIALFLFNFHNGQSGTSVFESFVMAGWNFFLALPIIAIGVFDEDVAPDQVLLQPKLYLPGQQNSDLNMQRFSLWIVNAIIQALLCFLMTVHGIVNLADLSIALYLQGTIIYSVLLMSANIKVVLETLSWTKFNVAFFAYSVFLFFAFVIVFQYFGDLGDDLLGVTFRMLGSIQANYFPTLANILRERSVLHLTSAQVASEPPGNSDAKSVVERPSFLTPLPGSVVASCKDAFALKMTQSSSIRSLVVLTDYCSPEYDCQVAENETHDISALKVIQFHREEVLRSGKLQSFHSQTPLGSARALDNDKYQVVVSDMDHDESTKGIEDLEGN